MLTFGSLFSGIGGIDLGLERAGMQCRWQSEIEPYACKVLKKHWPDTPNLGDVTQIDWSTVERTDVVAGGYPCQPFSYAGARKGEHDPRHLWPYFAAAIRVVRPRYALLENVSGHLSLGFGQVLADLAALGYDAEWDCIPAAAVGAPHLRDRVFVIATRQHGMDTDGNSKSVGTINAETQSWPSPMAYTNCKGLQRRRDEGTTSNRNSENRRFWQSEPNVDRVAYGISRRMDRLRALGNAVVPQVAEHVGRIIMEMAR